MQDNDKRNNLVTDDGSSETKPSTDVIETNTERYNMPSSNRRIAKNAVMLYIRMFLTMIVGLYTSRVVLNTLGVEDYGIYGVVGGVISMLGFLNASMSGATSRFLTFELGRGDKKRLNDTFSSALIVHIGIALVVFVIAETVGLWFLTHKLVIPEGRMTAAHWVYQCSIISAMLGITQSPYNATIIAHEKMDVYAYVEILNVTLKLLIVYLLVIGNFDKLILYAILMLAVSVLIRMVYRIYCIRHFSESHFHWLWNPTILKPMLSFSGWDLYGNLAHSARTQGSNFIINSFYGVVLNAACGIAATVQGLLLNFSTNIVTAFKPSIIKAYSVNDYKLLNHNLKFASKVAILLITLVTIPVYVKCKYVLFLWLKIAPDSTVVLTRLSLLMNLATCLSLIILIGIHATGKMLRTGAFAGTTYLMTLPIMYLMLLYGLSYKSCYVLFFVINCVNLSIYTIILRVQMPQFNIKSYYLTVLSRTLLYFILCMFISFQLGQIVDDTIVNLVFFCFLSFSTTVVLSFVILFNKVERETALRFLRKVVLQVK